MECQSREQVGDTTFKAWVATKFEPGKFDGYTVRMARWVLKEGVRAALTKGQVPSDRDFDCDYSNFPRGEWVRYTRGGAPGTDVPRGPFLDPHLDLLKDIEGPAARKALSMAIKQAREYERSPKR